MDPRTGSHGPTYHGRQHGPTYHGRQPMTHGRIARSTHGQPRSPTPVSMDHARTEPVAEGLWRCIVVGDALGRADNGAVTPTGDQATKPRRIRNSQTVYSRYDPRRVYAHGVQRCTAGVWPRSTTVYDGYSCRWPTVYGGTAVGGPRGYGGTTVYGGEQCTTVYGGNRCTDGVQLLVYHGL